jgi:hypothetical protein
MAYIKNKEHFNNIINKLIREQDHLIDSSKLLNLDMYWELQDLNLLDEFSWGIRSDPTLLHEDNYFNWRKANSIASGVCNRYIDKRMTKDFLDKAEEIASLPGIYSFSNESGLCLYLGVSIHLGERILSSFRARFINYEKKIYFSYLITQTRSDAHVLESAAIATLKPVFNTTGKYDDELTIDIKIPEFSHKILCNEGVEE